MLIGNSCTKDWQLDLNSSKLPTLLEITEYISNCYEVQVAVVLITHSILQSCTFLEGDYTEGQYTNIHR